MQIIKLIVEIFMLNWNNYNSKIIYTQAAFVVLNLCKWYGSAKPIVSERENVG